MFRQKVPILFTEARPSDTSDAHGSHLRSKVENLALNWSQKRFWNEHGRGNKKSLDGKKTRGVLQILETQPSELMIYPHLCPSHEKFHHQLVPPQPWHPVRYTRPKASLYQSRPAGEGFPAMKSTPLSHPLQWLIKRYTYYLGSALASLSVEARSYFLNKPYLQKLFPKSIQVWQTFATIANKL